MKHPTFNFLTIIGITTFIFNLNTIAQVSFSSPVDYPSNGSISVAVGDFNQDGRPDIVYANRYDHNISVLIASGAQGNFNPPVNYAVGNNPSRLAISDLNADGSVDIVVPNRGSNTLSILFGNSDGTFNPATSVSPGIGTPTAMAIADLNGDGRQDLVTASGDNPGSISVLLASGSPGSFGTPSTPITTDTQRNLVLGDLDTDGRVDLVLLTASATLVHFGNGDGTFGPQNNLGNIGGFNVQLGDLNGDNRIDIAIGTSGGPILFFATGSPGNFATGVAANVSTGGDGDVAIADLNSDGRPDLAASFPQTSFFAFIILQANGPLGNFNGPFGFSFGGGSVAKGRALAIADLNLDGKHDIIICEETFVGIPVKIFFNTTPIPVPTITNFTPTSGPVGTTVTITGTNFSSTPANNIVKFNGTTAVVTASTATSITTTVPAGATTGTIAVTVAGNSAITASSFTVGCVQTIVSTFDSNQDGWTAVNGVGGDPAFIPSGGNPDGFIRVTDNAMGPYTYFIAPSKFLGDKSFSYGKSFRFDLQVFSSPDLLDLDGDLKISGGGLSLFTSLPSFPAVAPSWSSYSFRLDTSHPWKIGSIAGSNATESEIRQVLSNITLIQINGEYAGIFNDMGGLDNVLLEVETPPTITSITPSSGSIGTTVVISGTNFDPIPANNIVKFNGVSAIITGSTITSLTTSVPTGATTGPIEITVGCNTVTSGSNFVIPVIPSITNFTPSSGSTGTAVIITGANFSTIPANNTVYFGATRATVTAATTNQLTVIVPTGATYQPITVQVAGLTTYSSKPFVVTFSGGGKIEACSFVPPLAIRSNPIIGPLSATLVDLDGDGKIEIVNCDEGNDRLSITRNISTSGILTVGSFESESTLTTGDRPVSVAYGDLDGDGRPDLAVANFTNNYVSIFKNISTAGTLAFAPRVDITVPIFSPEVVIADFDLDGKLDLAISSNITNQLIIYRNIGILGILNSGSFAAGISFATGNGPFRISLGDLDGDNKVDAVVPNLNTYSVSIFRNTSTIGNISFAPQIVLTTAVGTPPVGFGTGYAALGDIDGDGVADLTISNLTINTISIYRNTSTTGIISFDPKFDLNVPSLNIASVNDIDGDGKIDLVYEEQYNSMSIYKNVSSVGLINVSSFSTLTNFSTPSSGIVTTGDIDGDGKSDFITNTGTVSILRNVIGEISPPTISSLSNSSGPVGSTIIINGTNFITPFSNSVEFNGVPATITASTATTLTVTVPVGATTGPIEVTIGCNTVTSTSNFTVTLPGTITISSQPTSSTVCDETTTSFTIAASGTTNISYQWQKFNGTIFTDVNNGAGYSGATSTSFNINTTGNFGAGDYRCRVSGDFAPDVFSNTVTLTINPIPIAPTLPIGGSSCGAGTVTLSVSGGTNGQYQWYTTSTGGAAIGGEVNSSYITPSLSVTTTYFAALSISGCESATRTAVMATINTVPASPSTPVNGSSCGPGSVTISVSGGTNGQYRWYTTSTGGVAIAGEVNSSYTTPSISVATTYYAALNISGCESATRAPVNASINATPPVPTATSATICANASATLNASGGANGEYRWHTTSTGGTSITGEVNDTYSTPTLTNTTSYFVSINDGTCESARTEVIATVLPLPTAPIVQPVNPVCPGSDITLTATGGTDGEYRWYDGATIISGAVNSTLAVANLTSAKTFSASIHDGTCESNKTSVVASVKSCTAPSVESTVATAFVNGIVAINLENLISDPEGDLNPASLQITEQPQSGAPATLEGFNLNIDYSSIAFSGTDRVTVGICDLTNLCTEQAVTIELGGAIKIYNAVSPNGDGKNEIFFIQYIDLLPETQRNTVSIYNRWGDEVFYVKNYNNTSNVFKGDGKNGQRLPSGTYFYKIVFTSGKSRTGFLELKY